MLYVAITRAEVNCVITYATSRYHNGQTKSCVISRFLKDIAPEYLLMGSTNSAPVSTRKRTRWTDDWEDEPIQETPKRRTEIMPRSTRPTPSQPTPSRPARPATPARPASPTPPPTGNGNFAIHTADELSEGCEILHQRFGRGTVNHIDTSGSDAKIDVVFSDGQTRKLLLKFAKFEIL